MTRRRADAAVLVLVLVVLAPAVGGCTVGSPPARPAESTAKEGMMTSQEGMMTPEKTKEFAQKLYQSTIEAAGGGDWVVEADTWNGPYPGYVQYSLGGGRHDIDEPDEAELLALTKKVQQAWAGLGITGKIVVDEKAVPVAYNLGYPGYFEGTDENRAYYSFQARSNRLIVQINAPAVPGDLEKIYGFK